MAHARLLLQRDRPRAQAPRSCTPTEAAPKIRALVSTTRKENRASIDWRWVGYGFFTMFITLSLAAIGVNAWIASDAVLDTTRQLVCPEILIALVSAASFSTGGFLIGWRSSGNVLWEPSMAAVPVVLFYPLLFSTHISLLQLGGEMVSSFVFAFIGGIIGERFAAA